jgi:hypothetical protein
VNFNKKYWVRVGSAHFILTVIDWLFDNLLYITVIALMGPLQGGLVMTLASIVLCAGYLVAYERMKIDWLGVNAVEAVKEHGADWIKRFESRSIFLKVIAWVPSRIFLLVLWAIKKNDVTAFIALSIYEDAFKTTAFLRKGRFDGFGIKDTLIFSASIVLSNGYWIVRNSVIIEIGKFGWKYFNP